MLLTSLSLMILSLSQISYCLNILILGNGPFGNKNSKILHSYLDLDPNNTVISVLPLHLHDQFSSEIYFDEKPLSSEDFEEHYEIEDSDLVETINSGKLLNLKEGDHYYGEKLHDMWYVKSSPLASMLFALDFVIPHKYSDLEGIDLIIIGPNEDKTIGFFDQYTKTTSQMMKLALLRNIPTIHLSGLQIKSLESKILQLDDDGLDSSNGELIEALRNLNNLIVGLTADSYNNDKHNFHASRAFKTYESLETFKSSEHKNNQNRLLPNGVGLNINFNIRDNGKCTDLNTPFQFMQTRSIRGYNKLLTLDYVQGKDEFKLKQIYNIDDELKRYCNGAYLSEFSTDDKNCVISVTPVNWKGDDYEDVEFLGSIFDKLNDGTIVDDYEEEEEQASHLNPQSKLKLVGQI